MSSYMVYLAAAIQHSWASWPPEMPRIFASTWSSSLVTSWPMRGSPWTSLLSVQHVPCAWALSKDPNNIIVESTEHVLVSCRATSEVRSRLFPELMNKVSQVQPMSKILDSNIPSSILTQFIIDCASFNLPTSVRIPVHNPGISEIYSMARNWCYGIARERSRLLKQLSESKDDRRQ